MPTDTIKINIPILTRVEGEGALDLTIEDRQITNLNLRIYEPPRYFEKFLDGRSYRDVLDTVARICGICPVSHLVASAKACDALMAVQVPPVAAKLRYILHLGQMIQSHALSFFHLSSPDLLLGMDSDPALRNIVGVIQAHPCFVLAGTQADGVLQSQPNNGAAQRDEGTDRGDPGVEGAFADSVERVVSPVCLEKLASQFQRNGPFRGGHHRPRDGQRPVGIVHQRPPTSTGQSLANGAGEVQVHHVEALVAQQLCRVGHAFRGLAD